MIFARGEHITFPQTVLGRERAREFAAAHLGRAEQDKRHPHLVTLLCDFELKPIGVPSAKITPIPTVAATLSRK